MQRVFRAIALSTFMMLGQILGDIYNGARLV